MVGRTALQRVANSSSFGTYRFESCIIRQFSFKGMRRPMAVNRLENGASSLSGGTEFDSLAFLHFNRSLAQWLEYSAFTRRDVSSSLTRPTSYDDSHTKEADRESGCDLA